jgi:hypothetical protein
LPEGLGGEGRNRTLKRLNPSHLGSDRPTVQDVSATPTEPLRHSSLVSVFGVHSDLGCRLGQDDSSTRCRRGVSAEQLIAVRPEEIPSEACRVREDLSEIRRQATAGQCNLLLTVGKCLLTIGAYREVAIAKPGSSGVVSVSDRR